MIPNLPEPACILARGLAGARQAGDNPQPPAVLISRGRVAALSDAALAAGAEQLDLRHLWLSPAPIDAHVHLWMRGDPAENLARNRQAGVAAVRDLGRHPKFQEESLPGREAPVVISSTRGLGKGWLAWDFPSLDKLEDLIRDEAGQGARFVKLYATGLLDFERPGQVLDPMVLSKEEMVRAAALGSRYGLKLAVHVNGADAVRAACEAGAASIEHGFFMDEPTLAALAGGPAWCPTIAPVLAHRDDPGGRHSPDIKRNLELIVQSQMAAMRRAEELGVNLVLGTDAGSYGLPHGQAVFTEMAAWLEAGLKPRTVFEAATSRAAELVGLGDELGSIKAGARAWLLGVAEDPRQNPLTLAEPAWRGF